MVQANPSRRLASEGAAVLVGTALLVLAWMMDERWLITHFPPDYFPPYSWIENAALSLRIMLSVIGACVIFPGRRQVAAVLERALGGKWILPTAVTLLAIILALVAAEFILRSAGWQSVLPGQMQREPLRLHDPVLGWIPKPSHTGYLVTGGRRIGYSTDAFGYRQRDQDGDPDFTRPTIVLAGESVMGGFGLNWDESISAQLARRLGTQVVDLSVGGYATDQIYLRLKSELGRFRRPIAVVMLFSPMLFRRNVENGRPHLGPDLVLQPAVDRSRLMDMARWAIPYRSLKETDRAVQTTRAILNSVVGLARSRGAIPIIFVPQFVPENPAEQLVRARVLGNSNVPVLQVALDPRWHLAGDWHPDARAANVMAIALERYLRPIIAGVPGGRARSAAPSPDGEIQNAVPKA